MTITTLDILKWQARERNFPYCEYCANDHEEIVLARHEIRLLNSAMNNQVMTKIRVCPDHKDEAKRMIERLSKIKL